MASTELTIAFIGRLTGPKGELAKLLLREVFPRFSGVRFVIAGGPVTEEFRHLAADARVTLCDVVEDPREIMRAADLVIGSGRVALEAMQQQRPVLAVGEACRIGFVAPENFAAARRSNFGDSAPPQVHRAEPLVADLERFQRGYRPPLATYPDFLAEYAMTRVGPMVLDVYREAVRAARLPRRPIPVLTYHRVVRTPPADSRARIYVTREQLAAQLRQLARRGFETITFRDLLTRQSLPRRPVILSFDDGYRDNYQELLSLLETWDARAVIFVLGDRALRSNTWDRAIGEPEVPLMEDGMVRACHASGRIEIGSHGLTHCHLPQVSEAVLLREVRDSRRALEDLIGAEVGTFAYPYGEFTARERQAVAAAGYAFGVTTDRGPLRIAEDPYAVRRIPVFPNTRGFGFWKKTAPWYGRYRKLLGRG